MSTIASQITSLTIVCSTVYSGADQSKHQSSASLAFVWGIHRGPVNSPHKWPVTRKMFPFDDVIMCKSGNWQHGTWCGFKQNQMITKYNVYTKFPRIGGGGGGGGVQLPSFLFPTTFFGGANIVLRELWGLHVLKYSLATRYWKLPMCLMNILRYLIGHFDENMFKGTADEHK